MLRWQSLRDAAASPRVGVRPWGDLDRIRLPLRGGGGSNSRRLPPVDTTPGPSHLLLGNATGVWGWRPAGLAVDTGRAWPWVQAGTSPGGADPPSSVFGNLPGVLGGSSRLLPAPPVRTRRIGDAEGSGSRGGSGPSGGAPARSPGATATKRSRAAGTGSDGAVDFVVVCSGPEVPRFTPKNERGGTAGCGAVRDRVRGCGPAAGHRRGHFCRFRCLFFFFFSPSP